MANVTTSAETNVIKAANLKRAREIEFLEKFKHDGIKKLMEVLGASRLEPVTEGTTLYVLKNTGELVSGSVAEGEIIPLTQIAQTKTTVDTITLNKWRKAATAEAIAKSGSNCAILETDAKLLSLVQKGIRAGYFTTVLGLSNPTETSATGLQALLAKNWAQLQVLFEDDAVEPVHFINPLDIGDYLASASITTQTAFGFKYVEDFLGLGTVIMSSQVTQGTVISTAKENIVVYYIPVSGDLADTFDLSADDTGLIGINSGYANNERAQAESLVISGIKVIPEYEAGIVIGTINPS